MLRLKDTLHPETSRSTHLPIEMVCSRLRICSEARLVDNVTGASCVTNDPVHQDQYACLKKNPNSHLHGLSTTSMIDESMVAFLGLIVTKGCPDHP